jgi:hypothetical protein
MLKSRLVCGWVMAAVMMTFLLGPVPGSAAQIDLSTYMMTTPGQWNQFKVSVPTGYDPFKVYCTMVTSGPFAGKLRVGDYLAFDEGQLEWMIRDYDATKMYVYDSNWGTFDPPLELPRLVTLDKVVPHAFEPGIFWYYKIVPSITLPAGTFQNVLAWVVLDSQYPPNKVNTQLGLGGVKYGVTAVDWYSQQVADLGSQDVDAATGNLISEYWLQAYGLVQNIDLVSFLMREPGQQNRFKFIVPADAASFTVTATRLTAGPFAGKLRVGDYLTPDPGKFQWVIMDWDNSTIYLYATNLGTYDPPIEMPRYVPLNSVVPHPFEEGMHWYFKITSRTVPAGTFSSALAWITLDEGYEPNAANAQLGLAGVPYAVTAVDWYASRVGDLGSQDVDAATGNMLYDYQLDNYILIKHDVVSSLVTSLLLTDY